MNAIEIIALIGVIILFIVWCYYRVRLIKARKEGVSLQAKLKQKEETNAKDNSKSSKS